MVGEGWVPYLRGGNRDNEHNRTHDVVEEEIAEMPRRRIACAVVLKFFGERVVFALFVDIEMLFFPDKCCTF